MNKNIIKILIMLQTVFICCLSCKSGNNLTLVSVSARQLLVDNQKYVIKGVCYNPVPKGTRKRNFDNISKDIDLMKEAGINTIRVYAPIQNKETLDKIAESGIKVIIGFGYNQEGVFDIKSGTFTNYISQYKNHPAILMWEFGNEYNYHPEWFDNDINNWYNALENASKKAKEIDKYHPTTTAHGDIPTKAILNRCPNVDVWGMNVYRWDKPETIFKEWKAISNTPMYLSEAGADSYMTISRDGYRQGPNQMAQADANTKILQRVFENTDICSGVALFSFSDEWWKAGNLDEQDTGGSAPNSSGVPYDGSPNEEYWGIVDIDGNKKETFKVVQSIYQSN